jgi:hypothetical protein
MFMVLILIPIESNQEVGGDIFGNHGAVLIDMLRTIELNRIS